MDEKALYRSYGEHLRGLREKRGLSQPVLADRAGIAQRKLSDIERGEREARFSAREWDNLARELGVSLHEVMQLQAPTNRVEPIARFASDLTDSDIAALTSVARQIASRPQPTALPAELDDVEGIENLTEGERRALAEAIELRDKADRMGGRREDQAPGGRDVGEGRKPRRQRSRQVD